MADVIRLRPHHVHRLFYAWQGMDITDIAKLLREHKDPKYSASHIRNVELTYRRLFEDNAPFRVVPSIDDICRKCSVRKEKRPNCTYGDDLLFYRGLGYSLGIDFEEAIFSIVSPIYFPFVAIGNELPQLKRDLKREKRAGWERRSWLINELETKINSLQEVYGRLCLKVNQNNRRQLK